MIKVKLLSKSQSAFDIFPFFSSVTFIYEILPPPAIYSFQINCWLRPSGKWCGGWGDSINIFYKHKTILTLVWRLWPRIQDTSYSSWKQMIYLALLVNPLLPHIRPEHHPGLEMEIHSAWGSRSSYNICLKNTFSPLHCLYLVLLTMAVMLGLSRESFLMSDLWAKRRDGWPSLALHWVSSCDIMTWW